LTHFATLAFESLQYLCQKFTLWKKSKYNKINAKEDGWAGGCKYWAPAVSKKLEDFQ
jgi:hypothetical protein